jgi:transposase-like protein
VTKRVYSQEDRAATLAALKANGGNLKKTATQAGVPARTLRRWRDGQALMTAQESRVATQRPPKKEGDMPPVPPGAVPAGLLAQAEAALDAKCEAIAHQAAGLLAEKLHAASPAQLAVILGVMVDKMRLLRDGATSISGTAESLTDEERLDRLRKLYERARARSLGRSDGSGTDGRGHTDPTPGLDS